LFLSFLKGCKALYLDAVVYAILVKYRVEEKHG